MSSCSALDDCISDSFSGFSIDGVADFVQNDVVGNASTMLGYVSDAMKVVDSAVSDAARLLQGDISVLLPPPSSGKNFVEQVQKMWRTGKRLYGNASDLVTMIKTLSGVSLGSDLQPRGVWKTDSKTNATATQQRNVVASTLRTTAISEAAYAVTRLPAPTTSAVMQNATMGQSTTPAQSTGWPSVTHPALNNAPAVKNTVDLPTWEELTDIRDTLNTAIDKELSRTTSDALFLALRRVKADLNAEPKAGVEHLEPYGFTARANSGAEAVVLFPDGDRSHAVVVTVSDRRYRLKGLQTGEVAVYDDQGQSVTLTREGIVVDGAGKTITFRNAPEARFEMDLEVTGQVKDLCDSGGTTMSAMRLAYNGHRHRENGQGSNTDKPDKAMEA